MCNLAYSSILQMHQNHFNRPVEDDDVFYEDHREHAALILDDNTIELVFDELEDLPYYSKVGDLKVIGYVILDDENYPEDEILDAFNRGFNNFADYWKNCKILMTGRHLLGYEGVKGYIYDKTPIDINNIMYAEAFDDCECPHITLHFKDGTSVVYGYGLCFLEDISDYKALQSLGVEIR